MLTPEYLDRLTDDILGMYDRLNEFIVCDIARRIIKAGRITKSAEWQIKQVQEAGLLYGDVIKRVSEISGHSEKEMTRLFQDAAVENIKNENDIMSQAGLMPLELKQSDTMLRILKAGIEKTSRDLSNLTLTTAVRAQNAYYNATNLAYLQVSSGALSYQEAIKQAIISASAEGTTVLYPSGHIDKLDVAVRRAVLTGVNQTAAKMSMSYCEETGCDYVETTAHSGARPSHADWQGQVFCISGKDKNFRSFSDTGYGTGGGLCGWNCRHSFHAFIPGISTPAYTQDMLDDYNAKKYEYDGKKYTEYEISQMQRQKERKIRETRRQLAACDSAIKETDDKALKEQLQTEFDNKAVLLKTQEAKLKEFCRKTGRRVENARLQVVAVEDNKGRIIGFNKSVSQKAVWANNKKYTEKMRNMGVEKYPSTFAKYENLRYTNPKEYRLLQDYEKSVKTGFISPNSGFENYKKLHRTVENDIVGMTTHNGIKITGQSKHFLDRVIGTKEDPKTHRPRNGVSIEDIQDALLHGRPRVSERSPDSVKFVTDKCIVSVNPKTGNLIQCNPQRGGVKNGYKTQ